MIRTPPQHNIQRPPGQLAYNFEKPLASLIEDHRQEAHQKALQDAFEKGKALGYYDGYNEARRRYAPHTFPDQDNSEAAR